MSAANTYPVTLSLNLDDKMSAALARSIDKANGRMSRAQTGWQKFQKAGIGDKFGMAGDKMMGIGKAMTVGVTMPLVALGAASVKSAMEFSDSMASVSTLIDTNKESIDDMGKAVLAMGKRIPVPLADLTEALYDVRSAGVSAADQFTVLEASGKLGVAGLGTTKQANDLLTSSLNAFGISAKDAGVAANAIFTTVKSGKTTIAGLAEGFGATAPAVAAAGIKLDDYLSNVAALTSVGMPAAQVHSQLKAVISGLTRETKSTVKVFGALGAKNLPDLIQKSGGLQQALGRISGELGGDSAKMLELVGSTEALNAMTALTTTQAKSQTDALASMRSGVDELGNAFGKKNDEAAAKFQRSKNALESAAVTIGTRLMPAVEKVADKIVQLTEKWDELSPAAKDTIGAIVVALAVGGPLLTGLGAAASAVSAIASAWGTVKTAAAGAQLAQAGASAAGGGVAATGGAAAGGGLLARGAAMATSAGAALTAPLTGVAAVAAPAVAAAAAIGMVGYAAYEIHDQLKDVDFTALDSMQAEADRMQQERKYAGTGRIVSGAAAALNYSGTGAYGAAMAAAGVGKPVQVENTIRLEGVPAGMSVGQPSGQNMYVDTRRGPVGFSF